MIFQYSARFGLTLGSGDDTLENERSDQAGWSRHVAVPSEPNQGCKV
jgi:hypothetical protein